MKAFLIRVAERNRNFYIILSHDNIWLKENGCGGEWITPSKSVGRIPGQYVETFSNEEISEENMSHQVSAKILAQIFSENS